MSKGSQSCLEHLVRLGSVVVKAMRLAQSDRRAPTSLEPCRGRLIACVFKMLNNANRSVSGPASVAGEEVGSSDSHIP